MLKRFGILHTFLEAFIYNIINILSEANNKKILSLTCTAGFHDGVVVVAVIAHAFTVGVVVAEGVIWTVGTVYSERREERFTTHHSNFQVLN